MDSEAECRRLPLSKPDFAARLNEACSELAGVNKRLVAATTVMTEQGQEVLLFFELAE